MASKNLYRVITVNRGFVSKGLGGDARDLEKQRAPVGYIACSDSRFDPDALGKGLQFAFGIRNAGNAFTGKESMASTLYTILHNNTELFLVIGHERCGAVGAVVNGAYRKESGALKAHLEKLAKQLSPYKEYGEEQGISDMRFYEEMNVDVQVSNLLLNRSIAEKVENGELEIVGLLYLMREPGREGELVITNYNGETRVEKIKALLPELDWAVERKYANPFA